MLLPFRALHLVPTTLCMRLDCLPMTLAEPVVERVPVLDLIGIETAFDLQLTQGFYALLAVFVATRWVLYLLTR